MPNYRRAFVPGGTWFFTATLLDRRSHLLVDRIHALRAATRWTIERHTFHVNAFVVLPDHIHTIWTLPPGDMDFPLRDVERGLVPEDWAGETDQEGEFGE